MDEPQSATHLPLNKCLSIHLLREYFENSMWGHKILRSSTHGILRVSVSDDRSFVCAVEQSRKTILLRYTWCRANFIISGSPFISMRDSMRDDGCVISIGVCESAVCMHLGMNEHSLMYAACFHIVFMFRFLSFAGCVMDTNPTSCHLCVC